ncbi:HK97-gp10 family putative phage morphogenesis protein [Methylobacterium isbiliense]|jgi:HK97 gp10 family phage protein|uniref:HK97 gp10 family phage protein n=1 Tax=Methylobacterium isbiliense TaxID=315478 RepID=A0ABQ4SGJ8_9HYPH|nr:HK97-gp10 family putative phage morphogenesis protein [Methylobacterium isbiliense]MDN3621454.1 HK97 gp10 family phage protein [Methylobacterium isbiliense]GJE00909.1 hypothetical protein GMJLKIPL_2836 [Methylobacterium isbiliense]
MIGVSISGLAALTQSLTLGSRVREAAQRAVEHQAEELADAIREAAPEDSGDLRDSVRTEAGEEPLTVMVLAGGTPETTKTSEAGSFDVAVMTEYGTSKTEPQPFFYPTVEARRDKMKANIDAAINREITGD